MAPREWTDELEDIDRLAVVGDEAWHRWVTTASEKVTPTEAHHSAPDGSVAAWAWLRSSLPSLANVRGMSVPAVPRTAHFDRWGRR